MGPVLKDKGNMTSTTIDAAARQWARRLEDKEAERLGASIPAARVRLARELGVPPGTLENIRRGRTKGLRGWIIERLRARIISQIEAEIADLQRDLEAARSRGSSSLAPEIVEAAAAIDAARAFIEETR